MLSFLKQFHYGDDICLLSRRITVAQQFWIWRKQAHSDWKKDFLHHRTLGAYINGQNIEGVEQFTYLLSVVSADAGIEFDVPGNTKSTFAALTKIWKCNHLTTTHQSDIVLRQYPHV